MKLSKLTLVQIYIKVLFILVRVQCFIIVRQSKTWFLGSDALLQHYENIIIRVDYGKEMEKRYHFELLRYIDKIYLNLDDLLNGLEGHKSNIIRLQVQKMILGLLEKQIVLYR